MKISVARFMVGTTLLGCGLGLSLAVWKNWTQLFPGHYRPHAAFYGFALVSAPGGAGLSLLIFRSARAVVTTTLALIGGCALIQMLIYSDRFY